MQYSINDSIFKQVVDQLDPKQFSMKRKSTCHALVFFLHTILAELDRGENYVRIFFADFSKGFDLVDHNVIMQELDFLGVNKYLSRWVGAFLTNRTQMLSISGMQHLYDPMGESPRVQNLRLYCLPY